MTLPFDDGIINLRPLGGGFLSYQLQFHFVSPPAGVLITKTEIDDWGVYKNMNNLQKNRSRLQSRP
jgi:hypothetical protein